MTMDQRRFLLSSLPARLIESSGKKFSLSTVRRWADPGLKRGGGARLRTELVGGLVFTRPEWVEEFLNRLNASRGD